MVRTGLKVAAFVPGPIGIAASAADQVLNCIDSDPGGCSTTDFLNTAVGMVPGAKIASGAGKVATRATFKTMKRSSPYYLGRAKDARAYGQFTEMRTNQVMAGYDRVGTGLDSFALGQEGGGYASDIASYY